MTVIDWQPLIAHAVDNAYWHMAGGHGPSDETPDAGDMQVAYEFLATRVPQACPTCKGLGCTCPGYCERADDHVCPDCPTVAKLLAIGAAVMTAPTWVADDWSLRAWTDGWNTAHGRLRAVEP
jgi:hypothetical protein